MKKTFLIVFIFAFLLLGCAPQKGSDVSDPQSGQQTRETADLVRKHFKLKNDAGVSPTTKEVLDDLKYAYVKGDDVKWLKVSKDENEIFTITLPKSLESIDFMDPKGYLRAAYEVEEVTLPFLSTQALFGSWIAAEGATLAQEIVFDRDAETGELSFNAYLNSRPFDWGTFDLTGNQLTLRLNGPMVGTYTVELQGELLIMTKTTGERMVYQEVVGD